MHTDTRTFTVLSQVFSFPLNLLHNHFILRSPSALNMDRYRTNSSFALGYPLYPLVACTFGPGFLVADPRNNSRVIFHALSSRWSQKMHDTCGYTGDVSGYWYVDDWISEWTGVKGLGPAGAINSRPKTSRRCRTRPRVFPKVVVCRTCEGVRGSTHI
jgi:hypothetical protein